MLPTPVSDVEEGLTELVTAEKSESAYQIVLADVHIPGINGLGPLERVKRQIQHAPAVIAMLTSSARDGEATYGDELEIRASLVKPVRRAELYEAVTSVFEAKGTHRSELAKTGETLGGQGGQARSQHGRSLDILLAEDNRVNQKVAIRLLEKRGHRVTLAATGDEAVTALVSRPYDLVLMDVHMPGKDGIQATIEIREREKITGLHQAIVAMTALAMKGDRERCLASGMDGYIAKPIDLQELDNLLDTHAERKSTA
jgi:two-component system, sensor histidine kinase and response regulator